MRILLVALNARYVHTNLAIRYLRQVLEEQGHTDWDIQIKEFSINDHLENVAAEIFVEKPDIIGFSCYIWNIGQTLSLLRRLRLVLPKAYLILGGPEVSYNPEELLSQNPYLDAVFVGEAEYAFPQVLKVWDQGGLPWDAAGLVWRFNKPLEYKDPKTIIPEEYRGKMKDAGTSIIFSNDISLSLPDLNIIPNPYAHREDFRGRLVYVETSRGCPFSCQFCISSTFRGIRYLEPERFRIILQQLFAYGARTIKFVDRTFNARKKHAFRILDVFREEAEKIALDADNPNKELPRAHCEMAGELLDEEWLEYLKAFPPGMIQLEIGVQSTHQATLEAVHRPQNFSKWQDKVRFLAHSCNIPVHLDLIAGLPFEGWQEFHKSFDDVFSVRPNNLQLGFLKVLKGSGIWQKSTEYGLVYSPDPPYTILRTKELSHGELLALSRLEEILERYYNSGRFKHSLAYILQKEPSFFEFFHSMAEYWQEKGWFKREWNPRALFENLWDYLLNAGTQKAMHQDEVLNSPDMSEPKEIWREALRFDYFLLERPGQVPDFLKNIDQMTKEMDRKKEEIRNNPRWQEVIPEARDLDKRQWARATAVERFTADIPRMLQADTETEEGVKLGKENEAWYLFFYNQKERKYYKF